MRNIMLGKHAIERVPFKKTNYYNRKHKEQFEMEIFFINGLISWLSFDENDSRDYAFHLSVTNGNYTLQPC